jgi:dTDP-4-dehydrorhamnose reductase
MSQLKLVIIGRHGQLARSLANIAKSRNIAHSIIARPTLDLNEPATVKPALLAHLDGHVPPAAVINATAYNQVDAAESDPELAMRINAEGPRLLAELCQEAGIPLIHVSTDFVFDGEPGTALREDDPTGPLSAYGTSKLDGELEVQKLAEKHVILRTAWLFSEYPGNFVSTMLRLARENRDVRVVGDQVGCPTPAIALANTIITIAEQIDRGDPRWGVFHYCGDRAMSWAEFALEIFDRSGCSPKSLETITSQTYGAQAARPAWSVLDCTKIHQAYGIERPSIAEHLRELVTAS